MQSANFSSKNLDCVTAQRTCFCHCAAKTGRGFEAKNMKRERDRNWGKTRVNRWKLTWWFAPQCSVKVCSLVDGSLVTVTPTVIPQGNTKRGGVGKLHYKRSRCYQHRRIGKITDLGSHLYSLRTHKMGPEMGIFFLVVAMIRCKHHRSAAHFLALTFMRHFALTIYGWMWVWRGRYMRQIHFPVDLGFLKGNSASVCICYDSEPKLQSIWFLKLSHLEKYLCQKIASI